MSEKVLPPKKNRRKIIGIILIVIGVVVLLILQVYESTILPQLKTLSTDPESWKKTTIYEGVYEELDTDNLTLKTYNNATGKKAQQLNKSDDKYLYFYGNVTVYDQNGNLIRFLGHSEPVINRQTYKEKVDGEEREFTFPLKTEKRTYRFGNPFVSTYTNTYNFVGEELIDGLNTYKYQSSEKNIALNQTYNNWSIYVDYEELIWIYPPTGSTVDQWYNISAYLKVPANITDIPSDYESYTNYTGTYTVLDNITYEIRTYNATGVLHLKSAGLKNGNITLVGNVSVYNKDDGKLIEVLAEINQTLNAHTHNFIVNGKEIDIIYNTTGYTSANPLLTNYTNTYKYIDSKIIENITAYHYRAIELNIPYDIALPSGLPNNTHLYLNYIEDIWIDPVTKLTLDQSFNISATLIFAEDFADVPVDYQSFTNYTGTFELLDLNTFELTRYENASGIMNVTSLGVYNSSRPDILKLTITITIHDKNGTQIYTLIDKMTKYINKTTQNFTDENGTDLPGAVYNMTDYISENPFVSGHYTPYHYIGSETKAGLMTYVYEAWDPMIPYREVFPGIRLMLNFYEKKWVDPITKQTIDQKYNITMVFPDYKFFPKPDEFDKQDRMFDEISEGPLYIFDGNFDGNMSNLSIISTYGRSESNATFKGYTEEGFYIYDVQLRFADNTTQTYNLTINPYTAEIMNFNFNGSKALFTFPLSAPNSQKTYYIWDPDMNMSFPAKYLRTESHLNVDTMVFEYKIDNVSFTTDRKFGTTLGQMNYNATVTFFVDTMSGLVIDSYRNITKYAPNVVFNITGTPLTDNHTFFDIKTNNSYDTVNYRMRTLLQQFRLNAVFSNRTAMVLDGILTNETINDTLDFRNTLLLAQKIKTMNYTLPAKSIVATYDITTKNSSISTSKLLATGLRVAGKDLLTMHIDARYTKSQINIAINSAKDLESKLNLVETTIPAIIATVAVLFFVAGALIYIKGRKNKRKRLE